MTEIQLPERLIRAFSTLEYRKTLSPRSRKILRREYACAASKRQIVVFVRDNETRTLKSSRVPIEPIEDAESIPEHGSRKKRVHRFAVQLVTEQGARGAVGKRCVRPPGLEAALMAALSGTY